MYVSMSNNNDVIEGREKRWLWWNWVPHGGELKAAVPVHGSFTHSDVDGFCNSPLPVSTYTFHFSSDNPNWWYVGSGGHGLLCNSSGPSLGLTRHGHEDSAHHNDIIVSLSKNLSSSDLHTLFLPCTAVLQLHVGQTVQQCHQSLPFVTPHNEC